MRVLYYTQESISQFLHNKPAFHNCHTIFRWCCWGFYILLIDCGRQVYYWKITEISGCVCREHIYDDYISLCLPQDACHTQGRGHMGHRQWVAAVYDKYASSIKLLSLPNANLFQANLSSLFLTYCLPNTKKYMPYSAYFKCASENFTKDLQSINFIKSVCPSQNV